VNRGAPSSDAYLAADWPANFCVPNASALTRRRGIKLQSSCPRNLRDGVCPPTGPFIVRSRHPFSSANVSRRTGPGG
jgi:hypothetical protein